MCYYTSVPCVSMVLSSNSFYQPQTKDEWMTAMQLLAYVDIVSMVTVKALSTIHQWLISENLWRQNKIK